MSELPLKRPDEKSAVPLHSQLEEILREWLRSPEYAGGRFLPPETKLADYLGVSRGTLRSGIDSLVRDGLLERKRGAGTRVIPGGGVRSTRLDAWISFTREMETQGIQVETFFQELRREPASGAAAEYFGIAEGTPVYVLERIKGFGGKRVVHFLSFFAPRIKLTGNEDFQRPMYEVLENDFGVRATRSREIIDAVMPTAELKEKLALETEIPLLRRERRVSDRSGRCIEFAVNHYRSDSFRYTVEIERS